MNTGGEFAAGGGVGGEGAELEGQVGAGQEPSGGVEQSIPRQRFDQVYGKMREYEKTVNQFKELGGADTVREQLKKLQQYEKAIEDYRQKASMTPDERTENERALQIQKELFKIMPSLKMLDKIQDLEAKIAEYEGQVTESATLDKLDKMSAKFTDTLKAAKIDLKYQGKLEDYIVSQMSKEQFAEFMAGNYEVAETIFQNELKDGVLSSFKKPGAFPPPPQRNTPGGTPPKGQQQPKTLKEAEDEAWARLKGE